MNIGPLGGLGAEGLPFAQRTGTDQDQAAQQTNQRAHQAEGEKKAESAAGIGETDGEDQFTSERDADGRRLWEAPPAKGETDKDETDEQPSDDDPPGGNSLDLTA